MKKFADFWRGMFYFTSTITMAVVLYLLVVVWQPIWTGGFQDFGKISQAIEDLDKTTKPAVAAVPEMLQEMKKMNQNMARLDADISGINNVMTHQMGMMNYQVNHLNNKFSPRGMMPTNW